MNIRTEAPMADAGLRRFISRVFIATIVASAFMALAAHGGINGGGRTRGVITAFGSIFVNGVEYDLAGSTISVNGVPATEDSLRIGQVVTVDGTVNPDLVTGQASAVSFDSDLRGAVGSIDLANARFTMLGQTVRVDGGTVFDTAFVPANLAGLRVGRVVEVSGFRNAQGQVIAARVQRSSSDEDRIVGHVASLDESASTFFIGGLRVDYSAASTIEGALENGALVEVEGPRASAGTLQATSVEVEDEGLDGVSGDGASLEGLVTTAYSGGSFAINGQVVLVTGATRFGYGTSADLVLNARAQAEGRFDANGHIVAEKVVLKYSNDAYVYSVVDAVDASRRTVQAAGLTIKVISSTRLEDKSDLRLDPFALRDLHTGDTIEVTGFETREVRNLTAKRLRRLDDDDRTRIGGRVSRIRTDRFTVLDVTVVTSARTRYRDVNDQAITAKRFYSTASNRKVKVRGSWDGTRFIADEVEFET